MSTSNIVDQHAEKRKTNCEYRIFRTHYQAACQGYHRHTARRGQVLTRPSQHVGQCNYCAADPNRHGPCRL